MAKQEKLKISGKLPDDAKEYIEEQLEPVFKLWQEILFQIYTTGIWKGKL